MITIRKIEGGETFDLPAGYVIEAEKNNPLFQNKGSQTVPVNFPATGKNNRLLNFPFRLDRSQRQEGTIGVIVETDSVQQKGLLSVNSASDKIITANIGYDESAMYAVMKDMQLRDMPIWDDPNHPEFIKNFGGNNTNEKVDSMLAHLTAVMKEQTEAEYYVFPVIVKKEIVESDGVVTNRYLEIINEVDLAIRDFEDIPYGKIAELKALENRTITRYENSEEIQLSAPKGYGVSPFIKVYRVLEIIFQNFGFSITENPFKEHRQLKKLVVLNNTIDAVLTGILHYKDLMPDCSIQEFLDSLYFKFGMLYFIDSNSNKIRIRFLKDILNPFDESGSIDLNKKKTEEPNITFSTPKQLRLKMNRELEDAQVTVNTMEEFLDRFNNQFTESPVLHNGITQWFLRNNNTYHINNIFIWEGSQLAVVSSDFFDWDKKTENIDYEDIDMKDLCLPLYNYGIYLMLQYLVGFKHQYSDIIVGGTKQEVTGDQSKIAFAFAYGLTPYRGESDQFRMFFASQFNRDDNGDFIKDGQGIKYDISLTCNREDGLFNRFWKEYDAFIRHSNQPVKCNLHLSDNDFINFKMDEKAFMSNQPFIVEQIKYKFNDAGDKISESTFRTLRLFQPFDLKKEQKIPQYVQQKYYWAWTSITTDPHPDDTRIDHVEYDPFYTINGIQTPISYVSFLPPTEAQFNSQETRIFKYRVIYKVFSTIWTVRYTVTYTPALIA